MNFETLLSIIKTRYDMSIKVYDDKKDDKKISLYSPTGIELGFILIGFDKFTNEWCVFGSTFADWEDLVKEVQESRTVLKQALR